MPEVSVILPCYNSIDYIDESIDSVINQTYQSFELIIVDDASTDGTYDYIKSKYGNDHKVSIYKNVQNKGVAHSRNVAIKHSKGRFLSFIDSDDIWDLSKLSEQVAFMKANNAKISHTSYTFINEIGGHRRGYSEAKDILDLATYLKLTNIGMSTVIVDSFEISDFKFPENVKREDFMLWVMLLRGGNVFHGLNSCLTKYRIRDSQASSNKLEMASSLFLSYMSFNEFSIPKRLSIFISYLINGILKRISRKA
ncbi:glycosyltransferase family 2 protein [Vibrio splendidus]|uniref:glycosyltransferase family 2 protein n=1 Tax=Vibrio splendidus TaxID=29497 RepID=UPI00076A7A1A|nr:glycosyltransferase family A protein [Vibrio splendidus]